MTLIDLTTAPPPADGVPRKAAGLALTFNLIASQLNTAEPTFVRKDAVTGVAAANGMTLTTGTGLAGFYVNATAGNVLNPYEYVIGGVSKWSINSTGGGLHRGDLTVFGSSNDAAMGVNTTPFSNYYFSIRNFVGTAGSTVRGGMYKEVDTGATAKKSFYADYTNAYMNLNSGATAVLDNTFYGVGLTANGHSLYVGQANHAAGDTISDSYGSSIGYQSYTVVKGVGNPANEHSAHAFTVRYDNGSGTGQTARQTTDGTPGRGWGIDGNVQGAIGVQQQSLSGIHLTLKNYVNKSPGGTNSPAAAAYDPTLLYGTGGTTNNASAGFIATAAFGGTGVIDPTTDLHGTATTYPNDIGFLATGSSGSTQTPAANAFGVGWRIGFQSGGAGGNYGSAIPYDNNKKASNIGIGFFGRDHSSIGAYLYKQYNEGAGTALGYVNDWNAGNNLFGTNVTNPVAANALARVQVGDNYPVTTLMASTAQALVDGPVVSGAALKPATLSLYTGALANTAATNIRAFSIGMSGNGAGASDTVIRNTRFYRNATGTDYTTASIGETFDANGAASYNGHWMTSTGHGFGATNYTPQAMVDIAGTAYVSGVIGHGVAPIASAGFKSQPVPSGAASVVGAYFGATLTPNAGGAGVFGLQVQPVLNAAGGTPANAYALLVNAMTASSGSATNAYGLRVDPPTAGGTNYSAWFNGGNVGIGTTMSAPTNLLDVGGTLHATGAATFDSTATITGNATLSGIVGVGRAPLAGFSLIIGGTLGSPASGNTQVLAVSPTVTPLSATSAYGVAVAMTVDTTAGTVTEAASFRSIALAKTGANAITTAYGIILSAPTSGATNRIAKFDGTTTNAAAQIAYMDKGGHLAFTSTTAPVSSGLLANTTSVTCTGTNQSGIITVVTSNTVATASTVATITFAGGGMEVAPKAVMLTPADSATWALAGTAQLTAPQASITATTFIIKSGSTSPAAGTYVYYYEIF